MDDHTVLLECAQCHQLVLAEAPALKCDRCTANTISIGQLPSPGLFEFPRGIFGQLPMEEGS